LTYLTNINVLVLTGGLLKRKSKKIMIEKYLTEEQIEELQKKEPPKRYPFCCLHSSKLNNGEIMSKDMDFQVSVVWYKGFNLKANQFAKIECPICHKVAVLPYFLGASALSGANMFKGYCFNCNTKLAFTSSQYYHFIKDGLTAKGEDKFLFATYSKPKPPEEYVIDNFFLNMPENDINPYNADRLLFIISGKKEKVLKAEERVSKFISINYDKRITDIEIKKVINDEETFVRFYGYDKKVKTKKANSGNSEHKLGSWTREMLKPENLIGPFETTEELMKSLWDENDENDEEN